MIPIEAKRKIFIFVKLIALAFIIGLLRFAWIQFIASSHLQEEVIENRVREIEQIAERGQITDRNGNVLAMSLMTQDIAIYPNLITEKSHKKKVAEVLSKNIPNVKYEDVIKKIEKRTSWERIARRVTPDITRKIIDSQIGAIEIKQSPKRFYPNEDLGGTFIGFVNENNVPGAGLEVSMNEYLGGVPGYSLAETTPMGEIIPVGFQNLVSPINGQNVQTTIDSYIQHTLEESLKKRYKELKAKAIHAVIMEPSTGEVVGMASYPSYDPNKYSEFDPQNWTNSPVNFTWEPGSIFKPIFMAAALNYGTVDGTEIFPSGRTSVQGTSLRDWNGGAGFGNLDFEGIIKNSSNVGMIYIGNSMSNKQVVDWLKVAGFDKPTGIQLPGEQIGFNFPTVKSLKDDPIRKATISFGQGISISPIQMVSAFSTLINGGHEIQPTIIKQVTDNNGNVLYSHSSKQGKQIYKPDVAEKVRGYLKANYLDGSGKGAQVEGYDGGGKTGTAWVVENGRYKDGAIIGSFIGFYPYENPKYSILVTVVEPKGVQYGSEAANPVVKDVMTEVLRYESIQKTMTPKDENGEPIRQEPTKNIEMPNVSWLLYEDAVNAVEKQVKEKVEFHKIGKGEVVVQQTYSYTNGKLNVHLHTKKIKEKDSYYIPILAGKTKEQVEELLKDYKIPTLYLGEGRVQEQSIKEGRQFKIDKLQIWLD